MHIESFRQDIEPKRYTEALGSCAVGWTSRLSLTSLTIYRTNVLYCRQPQLHNLSLVALYNFVFHISYSTCTSSVLRISMQFYICLYTIYMLYIYTLISQCIYINVLYPILFYHLRSISRCVPFFYTLLQGKHESRCDICNRDCH